MKGYSLKAAIDLGSECPTGPIAGRERPRILPERAFIPEPPGLYGRPGYDFHPSGHVGGYLSDPRIEFVFDDSGEPGPVSPVV